MEENGLYEIGGQFRGSASFRPALRCAFMRANARKKGEQRGERTKGKGRLFTARSLFRPRARGLSTFERPVCTAARITREGKRLEGGKRFNLHS